MKKIVFTLITAGVLLFPCATAFARGTNVVQVFNRTASPMTGRAVSVAKIFQQGNIAQFAQASGAGVSGITQCDVKNRWPDGSLKFAVVSFLADIPANGQITVSFTNQTSGNNTGFLTRDQMLDPAFAFDAGIQTSGDVTSSVGAREMLQADRFRYWLQGPIVTAVIIEDKNITLPYDSTKNLGPLHPIFEAWFTPSNHRVDTGYTLENCWASTTVALSMRDVNYSLILTAGTGNSQVFTHPTFNHVCRTRWHKRFWVGGDPGKIYIAHDPMYLIDSRAVPNFDMAVAAGGALNNLVTDRYASWTNADKTFDGGANGVGNIDWDIDGGGAADWIGPIPTWSVLWVMTQDERMQEQTLGNADLMGHLLMHFRERDDQAGTGNFFDAEYGATTGAVGTFGKVVSVNARKWINLQMDNNVGQLTGVNMINTGTLGNGGWSNRYGNYLDSSHMPDVGYMPYLMSGRFYYLEELEMQAAYMTGFGSSLYWGDNGGVASKTGDDGYMSSGQIRGQGWGIRTMSYGAFLSPDGTPEKTYFDHKFLDNIAFWEGRYNRPLTDSSRLVAYNYGREAIPFPTPLGMLEKGSAAEAPCITTIAEQCTSPWMEGFVGTAFGVARDFGYPTDNILRYFAINKFNLLLNPAVASPGLLDAYRHASTLLTTHDWIRNWTDFSNSHVAFSWINELGRNTDHSYGYISRSVFSFLYSYSIPADPASGGIAADGVTAWNTLVNSTGRATGKDWAYPTVLQTGSPKWSLLPRELTAPVSKAPARPRGLRVR